MNVRHDMIAVYVARPAALSWEFLQMLRRQSAYMGGTWSTIYGGVENGETAVQAALRELHEEAGIIPPEFFRLPTVRSFYTDPSDTVWHVPAFAAIIGREVKVQLNVEHTDFRWVNRDRVDQSFLWATDRAAIAEFCNEILSPTGIAREFLRIQLPNQR